MYGRCLTDMQPQASKMQCTSASWSKAAASKGSPPATVSVATERGAVELTASGLICASAVTPRTSTASTDRPASAVNHLVHELVPMDPHCHNFAKTHGEFTGSGHTAAATKVGVK